MKAWIIMLLSVTPLLAADFPDGSKNEILIDFSGGLDTVHNPNDVQKGFTPNERNVFVHRVPGNLSKRSGFIVSGTTLSLQAINLGLTFNHEDGSKEYLVSDDSVVLTTKDFNTYVLVSSALNSASQLEYAQVRNKIWFTNGSNSVFTWDGTNKVNLDGTNGTPNVPRAKYICYYQDRVFGLNIAGNTASLGWSDLSSTAGAAIDPDTFLAWPPGNATTVGRGDGQQGTAMWVYRGQLQIGKERSIYTLYGTNTASYVPRLTTQQAGVISQDSIVILDGLTYYKGYDGIYAYDGLNSQRISDLIKPDVDTMQNPILRTLFNEWDGANDFVKGQFYGSTFTVDGFVLLNTRIKTLDNIDLYGPGVAANYTLDSVNTSTGPMRVGFIGSDDASQNDHWLPYERMFLSKVTGLSCQRPDSGSPDPILRYTIKNLYNNLSYAFPDQTIICNGTPGCGQQLQIASPEQDPVFDYFQVALGSFGVQVDFVNSGAAQPVTCNGFGSWTWSLSPATTGQYISEVSTISGTINAWSNFNALSEGNVQFYFRASTSVINITTQAWVVQGPGSIINQPLINNFIQWASTLIGTNSNIDFVQINHIEGQGSALRPLGIDWKNEYWLSVSTELSSNMRLQYVKSWITNPTPNAWNVLSGYNISSLWKDGTSALYGGSSSTGTIYRLDYGTNDNGQAIDAFYDTPQMNFGDNWFQKQLSEVWVDAGNESSNLRLSLSVDGKAFTEELVDLTGTTRILKVLYNHNEVGKYYQFRMRNNDMDKDILFNGLGIVYRTLRTR